MLTECPCFLTTPLMCGQELGYRALKGVRAKLIFHQLRRSIFILEHDFRDGKSLLRDHAFFQAYMLSGGLFAEMPFAEMLFA